MVAIGRLKNPCCTTQSEEVTPRYECLIRASPSLLGILWGAGFWLTDEYFPAMVARDRYRFPRIGQISPQASAIGGSERDAPDHIWTSVIGSSSPRCNGIK